MLTCLTHAKAVKTDATRFMNYIAQRGISELHSKQGPGSVLELIGEKVGTWLDGYRPAGRFRRVFERAKTHPHAKWNVWPYI